MSQSQESLFKRWLQGYWGFFRHTVSSKTPAGFWHKSFSLGCWLTLAFSLIIWGLQLAGMSFDDSTQTYLQLGFFLSWVTLAIIFCYWFMQVAQEVSNRHGGAKATFWDWIYKPTLISILYFVITMVVAFIPFIGQILLFFIGLFLPFWMLTYMFEFEGLMGSFQTSLYRIAHSKDSWVAIGFCFLLSFIGFLVSFAGVVASFFSVGFLSLSSLDIGPELILTMAGLFSVFSCILLLVSFYSGYAVFYTYDLELSKSGIAHANKGVGLSDEI